MISSNITKSQTYDFNIDLYGFSLQSWTTPHLTRTCFMADMTESTEALGMVRISTVSFLGQYPYMRTMVLVYLPLFTYKTGWFWIGQMLVYKYSSTMVRIRDITRNLKTSSRKARAANPCNHQCQESNPPTKTLLHVNISHRIHGAGIYMLTWLGYIDGVHVTIYSSTMDPMGIYFYTRVATSQPDSQSSHRDLFGLPREAFTFPLIGQQSPMAKRLF